MQMKQKKLLWNQLNELKILNSNFMNVELPNNNQPFVVTTFYKFVPFKDVYDLQVKLIKCFNSHNLKGTILLATEGLNGTVAGSRSGIDNFYEFVKSYPEIADLEYKESFCEFLPFSKIKIKVKPEVVKFNMPQHKADQAGEYLDSKTWDEVITREDVLLIDTRNDYEVAFGTFKNAINPKTRNFTDLIEWVERNLNEENKEQTVAMFCTGGVRCEKSTALLKQKGFKKVYHLKGGILQYLQDTKNDKGLWEGRCFVFDDRIAVDANLKPYI